jgi:hypothetical protein
MNSHFSHDNHMEHRATSSVWIPNRNESIASHRNTVAVATSENDAWCTFALRRTTNRWKLPHDPCDYLVPQPKPCQPCPDRSSQFLKSPSSSDSVDRPNDTELLGTLTYDSPVAKRSRTTMATNNTNPNDIRVNFAESFALQSPRSVIMNEIIAHNTTLDDQDIEEIIFGTTTVECNDSVDQNGMDGTPIRRPHANHQQSTTTTSTHATTISTRDNENMLLSDDTFVSSYDDDDIYNEGLVWQQLLKDLKSVHSGQWKGISKHGDKDKGLKTPAVTNKNDAIQLHIQPASYATMVESSSLCSNGHASTGTAVSKHRPRFHNTRFPTSRTRSTRSNDTLTLSTYTGSSRYSMASSSSTDEMLEDILPPPTPHDITVVDTRPIGYTIVRRLSIFLIQNEKRWTMDKDIASLFPNYLSNSYEPGRRMSFRTIAPVDHVVCRRTLPHPTSVQRKYTTHQNCVWRLWRQYRRVKQRWNTLF